MSVGVMTVGVMSVGVMTVGVMTVGVIRRPHFYVPRKLNIILTQLRSSASFLNYDLFRVGIVSDPSCRCGAAFEDLKHFFLDCPIYLQARTKLIDNINMVTTCYTLDIKFLTCGNVILTYEQNCIIFKYVFDYIKCPKRFLIV